MKDLKAETLTFKTATWNSDVSRPHNLQFVLNVYVADSTETRHYCELAAIESLGC